MHDKLQTHLLCMIRDGETTLGKKDAEIRSLTKVNHAFGCDGMPTEGDLLLMLLLCARENRQQVSPVNGGAMLHTSTVFTVRSMRWKPFDAS